MMTLQRKRYRALTLATIAITLLFNLSAHCSGSDETNLLSKRIQQLVKNLDYPDKVAEDFAGMVMDWKDWLRRPVLMRWKKKLAEARQKKRDARVLLSKPDTQADHLEQIIQYYIDKVNKLPDILTVKDINTLFDRWDKFTLTLLQKKHIPCAKLAGKYVIPKSGIVSFLQGKQFKAMTQFHEFLWLRMDNIN